MDTPMLHPEIEQLRNEIKVLETELSELVYQRDKLVYHICPQIQADYMLTIGKLEYELFELHCHIMQLKRKSELIQAYLNRNEPVNEWAIDLSIKKEYAAFEKQLEDKKKSIDDARMLKSMCKPENQLTDEEAKEMKTLYTDIVKRLHPDIHPNATEAELNQLNDAINAYRNGNLNELRVIWLLLDVLTDAPTPVNSITKLQDLKRKLQVEIGHMQQAIDHIKASFPYDHLELLADEELMQKRVSELAELIIAYKETEQSLQERIDQQLNDKNHERNN